MRTEGGAFGLRGVGGASGPAEVVSAEAAAGLGPKIGETVERFELEKA